VLWPHPFVATARLLWCGRGHRGHICVSAVERIWRRIWRWLIDNDAGGGDIIYNVTLGLFVGFCSACGRHLRICPSTSISPPTALCPYLAAQRSYGAVSRVRTISPWRSSVSSEAKARRAIVEHLPYVTPVCVTYGRKPIKIYLVSYETVSAFDVRY